MKVFKFGGASINSIERLKNIPEILNLYPQEKIFIVISAMGKNTNALEKVVDAFYAGNTNEALQLFEEIKQQHLKLAVDVDLSDINLMDFFTEIEWLLHDKAVRAYDYYYDQIVCAGELLSSKIVSEYLNKENIKNTWIDVRDIVRTDDNFRDANVDHEFTKNKVDTIIDPIFKNTSLIITQGFIGSTDENESTTLGREGSDYSAALFANMLNAESLTIWKDVKGVMNADPNEFKEATYISQLNYTEVIEMAYYGAQVIHPKTIKPLQNKNIPLYVKCFIYPEAEGTIINDKPSQDLPPVIVLKNSQVLISLHSKDFSFVGEKPVSSLYEIFADMKVKPNIIQTTAISILICMDDVPDKIEKVALAASVIFDVQIEKDLTLLTVRHYNEEIIKKLTENKLMVLEQKTKETVQILMKAAIN